MARESYEQINTEIKSHEVGDRRPTAALLAWFLNAVWRLDLPEVVDAICDGSGDKGIDGIVVDDDLNEIAIFQSKYREKHDAGQGDKELRNLVGRLLTFRPPRPWMACWQQNQTQSWLISLVASTSVSVWPMEHR